MFEDAKKEYDQAIERNNALGELANQKSTTSGQRRTGLLTKIFVFGAVALAMALVFIL